MSRHDDVKRTLNQVSDSFCLAKWLQVTVHLQRGATHSCHHPNTHKVPLDELKKNPSALHNTEFKKEQRKLMLEGKKPAECQYCWNIENLKGKQISDRIIKSGDDWAYRHLDRVRSLPWDADIAPTYLEVSFSHQCNFKCIYCFPDISSSWEKEILQHGPYQLSDSTHNDLEHFKSIGRYPLQSNPNPYLDAFWKWLPKIYPDLEYLRITGGEPLLEKSTFEILDHVIANPHPNLVLCVNSNLGVPLNRIKEFAEKLKKIKELNACRGIQVFTSIDTWGKQAEYIRTGLKVDYFQKNLLLLYDMIPNLNMTIMCTFNALSVPEFNLFLKKVFSWKKIAHNKGGELILDISYLRSPSLLSIEILPRKWIKIFDRLVLLMKLNSNTVTKFGYNEYEIEKMQRIRDYFQSLPINESTWKKRQDFELYVRQLDQRRKTNFLSIFPRFKKLFDFWNLKHELTKA